MNCVKCGAENDDGAAVCKNCGESMEEGSVAKPVRKRGKRGLIIGIAAAVIVAAIAVIFVTVVLPSVSNATLECGNTPMNIHNGGFAAESDGWIYYCNSGDKRNLYKISTDGTGKTKLNDVYSRSINVVGDWIYYIQPLEVHSYARDTTVGPNGETIYHLGFTPGSAICRVRTDGTDEEIICEEKEAYQLCVCGDWMYYTAASEGGHDLFRMRTDGTEKTGYDVKPATFTIKDDWIYYIDYSDFKDLKIRNYKMRLDGSEKTELGGERNAWGTNINYTTLTDGWIYCNFESHLSKIREDGTEMTKLTDHDAMDINIADGWVYYSDFMKTGIYKVRTDGTEETKLSDSGSSPNIVGDWIYYAVKGYFYRMKTDGSENQPVN